MKIHFSDYTLGAGVVTALVNTSALVRRSTGEMLVDASALGRFLSEHDVPLTQGVKPTAEDLEQVLVLRWELRRILETTDEDHVAEAANALVGQAGASPLLTRDTDGHWQWYLATEPHASLAEELATLSGTGLLGVLRALSYDRVRHCASPVCDGMFIDTSKAGRRRYCMPDLCGNRLNVANHRVRRLKNAQGSSARSKGEEPSG
ncbi:CGNR zinc finger domain-containing protein [Streptomyces sp. NPDC050428]|uniref:CGNR zinc finger domain-containing protein n=1 Tax=Streptomyces sp. NPDC050428 TaxID=3155757 RepID=UPI00341587A5